MLEKAQRQCLDCFYLETRDSVLCREDEKVRSQETMCISRNMIQSSLHMQADAPEKGNGGFLQTARFVPNHSVLALTIFCECL